MILAFGVMKQLSVLYLSILLPSYSIGYNQYVCLNYARKGFYHLASYPGILYVTDSTEKLYGLRDRYGLLVKPEYEKICESNEDNEIRSHVYIFQKDGYKRYYNAYNNTFKESDIEPGLQHQVRELLEGYFAKNGGNCGNKGQITVMELLDGKTIADVRVTMWGNPFLCYTNESFLPDDSICVAHGDL